MESFKLLERLTVDPYCISSETLGPNPLLERHHWNLGPCKRPTTCWPLTDQPHGLR